MTARLAALVCALKLVTAGHAGATTADDAEAALDRRVARFSQEMRCLVCQNETLADSQADLAVDLRREIRDQMKAGRSDAEITDYLTARYGEFVRYRPALKPSTYALWLGPFVLLTGAIIAWYRGVQKRVARTQPKAPSAAERTRARALLGSR